MRVLIAAEETGSLQAINLSWNNGDVWSNDDVETTRFGAEGRSSYIQKMIAINMDEKAYILVARKGAVVQMYDSVSYHLVREWKGVTKDMGDPIVGLDFVDGKLCTCSARGKIVITDLTKEDNCKSCYMTGSEPVAIFRMHPSQPGVAAAGGKDRDLEVFRVLSSSLYQDQVEALQNSLNIPVGAADNRVWRMWRAKNVPNDAYGNAAPVWISDLVFLDGDDAVTLMANGWRIATATRFGEIRIYNTLTGRRPIMDIPVSNHPLTNIRLLHGGTGLFFVDTQDILGKIDVESGVLTERYKGIPGSAWHMDIFEKSTRDGGDNNRAIIVTGGLDRHLRIYDPSNGLVLRRKIYIGNTATAVVVLDGFDEDDHEGRNRYDRDVGQGSSSTHRRSRYSSSDEESTKRRRVEE